MTAAPAPAPRAEAPAKSDGDATRSERGSRRSKGRRGEGREPEENRVVFRDTPYVPAFLLRPLTPRKVTPARKSTTEQVG